ncbi:hypothetical protein Ciccas_003859 [Cichlidogyrus casuarinus]|uniref:CUB domain-containing protein n=1 Tax=Cichlidogyrus casuarinus TaxID=1844966 RepID=A0ABD2QDA1_9PLAT
MPMSKFIFITLLGRTAADKVSCSPDLRDVLFPIFIPNCASAQKLIINFTFADQSYSSSTSITTLKKPQRYRRYKSKCPAQFIGEAGGAFVKVAFETNEIAIKFEAAVQDETRLDGREDISFQM